MCNVSVGVEKLRLWWLGVKGKCVLNVDRYVWFVLWGWAKQGGWRTYVHDWMYEL